MNQTSEVLMEQKSLYDSEYILIDSDVSCKSSYSKISDEILPINNPVAIQPPEDSHSINYTINSPLSLKSLTKNAIKPSKLLKKKQTKAVLFKASLSLAESFQDPVIDSHIFNVGDISAIEGKSIVVSNSPENTNFNNSFITEQGDFAMFSLDGPNFDKEQASLNLKEFLAVFLNKSIMFVKEKEGKSHGVLLDNLIIIRNIIKTCNEKSEVQRFLSKYVIALLKENLSKNEEFASFFPFNEIEYAKQMCDYVKSVEINGLVGNYVAKFDVDLLKASFREEAISFLFRVKNFEEKQNLMNILMNTSPDFH